MVKSRSLPISLRYCPVSCRSSPSVALNLRLGSTGKDASLKSAKPVSSSRDKKCSFFEKDHKCPAWRKQPPNPRSTSIGLAALGIDNDNGDEVQGDNDAGVVQNGVQGANAEAGNEFVAENGLQGANAEGGNEVIVAVESAVRLKKLDLNMIQSAHTV